jgi:uncharacterized membrane protein YdbT with pleckstrin-like domain
VAFPDDSLTDGEHVVLHLHPHWKAMVIPAFWTIVFAAAVVFAAIKIPTGPGHETGTVFLISIGAVALGLFLWLAFAPFVVWRSTHFVFTNQKVLLREGVFKRIQHDIALNRVSDVKFSQNLFERLLGCGTLTVESAGEGGQSALPDIPKVVKVQKVVHELVKHDHDNSTLDDADLLRAMRQVVSERDGDKHE